MNKIKTFIRVDEYDNIINKYINKELNIQELAKFYNVSDTTIYNILKRKNIRNFNYAGRKSEGLNENYFENIDNEEKAYFLGYICRWPRKSRKKSFCPNFK